MDEPGVLRTKQHEARDARPSYEGREASCKAVWRRRSMGDESKVEV